jgi:hypothetical protein
MSYSRCVRLAVATHPHNYSSLPSTRVSRSEASTELAILCIQGACHATSVSCVWDGGNTGRMWLGSSIVQQGARDLCWVSRISGTSQLGVPPKKQLRNRPENATPRRQQYAILPLEEGHCRLSTLSSIRRASAVPPCPKPPPRHIPRDPVSRTLLPASLSNTSVCTLTNPTDIRH